MKKIILSLFAVFALSLCVTFINTTQAETGCFPDTNGHQYEEAICFVKNDLGLIQGYPDGTFKPENTINRAEFSKIFIGYLFGHDLVGSNCFPDVTTDWYAKYVCVAKELGAIGGYPDGTFKPTNNINLAETLKIIMEVINVKETLAPDEDWFIPYLNSALNNNLLTNIGNRPSAQMTRAEMAELFYQMQQAPVIKAAADGVRSGTSTTPNTPSTPSTPAPTTSTKYTITKITDDTLYEQWPSIDYAGNNVAFGRSADANDWDIIKKNLTTNKETVVFQHGRDNPLGGGYLTAEQPLISGDGKYVAYTAYQILNGNRNDTYIGVNEKIFSVTPEGLGYPKDCYMTHSNPMVITYGGNLLVGFSGECVYGSARTTFELIANYDGNGFSVAYGPQIKLDENNSTGPQYEVIWANGHTSIGPGVIAFDESSGAFALSASEPNESISNIYLNTELPQELLNKPSASFLQFSKDGKKLFYFGLNGQLFYLDMSSRKIHSINTSDGELDSSSSIYPFADPTGTKIHFATKDMGIIQALKIVGFDGSGEMVVAEPGKDGVPDLIELYGNEYGQRMAANGSAIIFEARDNPSVTPNYQEDMYLARISNVTSQPPAEKSPSTQPVDSTDTSGDDQPAGNKTPSTSVKPPSDQYHTINDHVYDFEHCVVYEGDLAIPWAEWLWWDVFDHSQTNMDNYTGSESQEQKNIDEIWFTYAMYCFEVLNNMRVDGSYDTNFTFKTPEQVLDPSVHGGGLIETYNRLF